MASGSPGAPVSPDPAGTADGVFAAVASPARRELLGLLLERGPLPAGELAAHFAMRRPSVAEHLRVLKDAGLVSERRDGRHRYYRLEPRPLLEVSRWLSPYERFWRRKLAGLRDLLDADGPGPGEPGLSEPGLSADAPW